MNTLEAIFKRKSVRSYTDTITEEELATILKAANAAPIGRALYENVHLTVITNKELLDKIDANGAAFFNNPEMKPLYQAPVYILASARLTSPADNVGYSNCAIIVQNMALAAVELGIGSCHIWGATVALGQNEELLKEVDLPDGFTPCCGIILGKTEEVYAEREILEDRIAINYLK